MKSKLLVWLLLFLSFFILRNALALYHALVYATNLDGLFHLAGSLVFLLLILLLLVIVTRIIKKPLLTCILWGSALTAALFTPAYSWPENAWKIAYNSDRYDALIAGAENTPRFAVLEARVFDSLFGHNATWLVYDESDQTLLPSNRRSDDWKKQAPPEIASTVCRKTISRIREHYYFVFEEC